MDKTDRDESLSKVKEIEQLETLAFHFTQLSKRLSQDREYWAETGKDLGQAVENLHKTIESFADLEQTLKTQVTAVLQQESREAAQAIAQACRDTTQQVLGAQIKVTADHLSQVVYQTSHTLTQYQGEVKSLKTWFLMGVTLSALIGNILAGIAVYYFLLS